MVVRLRDQVLQKAYCGKRQKRNVDDVTSEDKECGKLTGFLPVKKWHFNALAMSSIFTLNYSP